MTKNSKVRTLAGLVVGAMVIGAVAIGVTHAQQPGPKRGEMMGGRGMMGERGMRMGGRGMMMGGPLGAMRRGLAQLDLTDQQKLQVKVIVQGHKDDLKRFAERAQQARRAVGGAIASDADETTIRSKSDDLSKAQADLAVFGAKLRKDVLATLTPEQRDKAKTLRLKALDRADRFIERRKKLLDF